MRIPAKTFYYHLQIATCQLSKKRLLRTSARQHSAPRQRKRPEGTAGFTGFTGGLPSRTHKQQQKPAQHQERNEHTLDRKESHARSAHARKTVF